MVTCHDGWILRADVLTPPQPRAVAVVGHAMMVDRRTLDRPRGRGLVSHLSSRGVAVVCADLRGHGQSGPRAEQGGRWCYDDLVEGDVPALVAFARAQFPGLPLTCVGHSLFGHAALGHLCRHPDAAIDKLVLIACNYTHPEWGLRALADKGSLIVLMSAFTRLFGRFPTRRLKLGSDDESAPFIDDFVRGVRTRDWRARDGFSYAEARARVNRPIFAIAGAGDRVLAPPPEARSLVSSCPRVEFHTVGRRTGLPFDPGHMTLVLDERARPAWDQIADFILGDSRESGSSPPPP
jgi:oxygen-independent coproporphyrinogen-3 oxidase